jgi:hypothetical protein
MNHDNKTLSSSPLHSKLTEKEGLPEDVLDIKEQQNIKKSATETTSFSEKEFPLDQNAIQELANIFEEHPEAEALFSEEKRGSSESLDFLLQNHEINYQAKNRETFMNTESDIFSSPKSLDSDSTQTLTKRLYSHATDMLGQNPYINNSSEANLTALEELKKLAESSNELELPALQTFISDEIGVDSKASITLEKRMASFQLSQKELIKRYLKHFIPNALRPNFTLFYLNGWPSEFTEESSLPLPFMLTEQSRKSTGGIFIRWNGKGIAINPGVNFLHHFHAQGLHIHDIDYVIVTGSTPSCYADVKDLYEINYELNKAGPSLHVIHYYFSHHAFQELSRVLKPHFKQERETLHSLEIFLDSPDVEKVELAEGILLHYFSTSNRETFLGSSQNKDERSSKHNSELGIKLEMKTTSSEKEEKAVVRLGYIGQCAWNPLLAHHLGHCDLLITCFGNTSSNDINQISYNTDCLGYHGSYTLLEEVAPKLHLCGEFGGREGDIRLEVCQKIRSDYYAQRSASQRDLSAILPADIGLCICLKSLYIKCPISNEWVAPGQVQAAKTSDSFGKLVYLAPSCYY